VRYEPARHHRRSIRLRGYDYSQAGAYFVTICTQNRLCLFGKVLDGEMQPNDAGRMIEKWWLEMNCRFPTVETDEYIVMPNHFHGIVVIVRADLRACPDVMGVDDECCDNGGAHTGASLPSLIQWFKTMTTNEYIRRVKISGWPPFVGKLWQRNYYEHIIRDEESLNRIRTYIGNNPLQWELDRENPSLPLQKGQPHRAVSTGDEPWRD
jgi:putative transposase